MSHDLVGLHEYWNWGSEPMSKPKPKIPTFTRMSDKRVVTSLNVLQPPNTATLPKKLMIAMEEALELGVPVQVQFEIVPTVETGMNVNDPQFPDAPGVYVYLAKINSVRARIKPGTLEFVGKEESNLNHIINDTEGSAEAEKRAKQRMQIEKEKNELNRFTGLEL